MFLRRKLRKVVNYRECLQSVSNSPLSVSIQFDAYAAVGLKRRCPAKAFIPFPLVKGNQSNCLYAFCELYSNWKICCKLCAVEEEDFAIAMTVDRRTCQDGGSLDSQELQSPNAKPHYGLTLDGTTMSPKGRQHKTTRHFRLAGVARRGLGWWAEWWRSRRSS